MGAIAEDRKKNPGNDIVSGLLECRVDGRPFNDQELGGILYLLFLAGLDTVASMLGWTFMHLAQHTDDRKRITADPTLSASTVEELLRYYSIVSITRHTTADVEMKGCPIKKGDRVIVPSLRPTATRKRSPMQWISSSTGPRTATSPSGPDRTAAWGRTWRASSFGWPSRSGTASSPTTPSPPKPTWGFVSGCSSPPCSRCHSSGRRRPGAEP